MCRHSPSLLLLIGLALGAVACVPDGRRAEERLREAGEVVVLTLVAPTTYYIDADGNTDGFEFALTQNFAEDLGVEARYELYDSIPELLQALRRGEGDIAAAGLLRSGDRGGEFLVGPDYMAVRQEVVCRRGGPIPRNVRGLTGESILVLENGNAEQQLVGLKTSYPELAWFTASNATYEQIFEAVWDGTVDCAVADSNVVTLLQPHYPELQFAVSLPGEQRLSWMVGRDDHDLQALLDDWFGRRQTRLSSLRGSYFGSRSRFDFVDIKVFLARTENRLPQYHGLFVEAGAAYGIDWTLLAAQAYQESHWNPRAKSPTGVRGIMMLTQSTAGELGVTNRRDPVQSIDGGARYLAQILRKLPPELDEADRIWFALAAYNVGLGHVLDARVLTERRGRDPNSWHEVQRSLTLLSEEEHYRDLEYGFARGSEALKYVRRIRSYDAILDKRFGG
jgi:membrane-bound lytic murein transglycosylase F